jgi:hypothetical protein
MPLKSLNESKSHIKAVVPHAEQNKLWCFLPKLNLKEI